MPDVLEFPPFYFARRQGQSRMLAFQRLHPGQFIGAEHPFPLRRQGRRFLVQMADIPHPFFEEWVVGRGQPVADTVGLESPLFRSRRT